MKNIHSLARPLAAALLLSFLIVFPACDGDGDDGTAADVTVMTYNLYLGADLFNLIDIPANQVPLVAAQLFANVQATDFAARAQAIADLIEEESPALIGLQEVSLYRGQSPGDNLPGGAGTPATTVVFDFLDLLTTALTDRGLDYRVAARTENADVELPSTVNGEDFTDIRLTDYDVILARGDVQTADAVEANFTTAAGLDIGGMEVPFTRGYNSVQAIVGEVAFTFVNAHLEVDDGNPAGAALVQAAQADELVRTLEASPLPVVLVGDFNSAGDGTGTTLGEPFNTTTYGLLTSTYTDAAVQADATDPTCCQADDLANSTSTLSQRIDLILHRGGARTLSAEVVGDEPGDRVTVGGELLWPSDHAGVVATLRITN